MPQAKPKLRFYSALEMQAKVSAQGGLAVFPIHGIIQGRCACGKPNCDRPGKHPVTSDGFKSATVDIDAIAAFWKNDPFSNVGIATGAISGIFVLDVDGLEGQRTLVELERVHGPLPRTLTIKTGNGLHFYFKMPHGIAIPSSVGRIGRGIDIRADGGYVVGPKSKHANGSVYMPQDRERRVRLPPSWLIEAASPTIAAAVTSSYGQAALREECARVSAAKIGTRNDTLNKSAFKLAQLLAVGKLQESEVLHGLTAAALRCGLNREEIERTIQSALRAGNHRPREGCQSDGALPAQDALAAELCVLGQTDDDNGERFARRCKGSVLYTGAQGYFIYSEGRWTKAQDYQMTELAARVAEKIAYEASFLTRDNDRAARTRFSESSRSRDSLARMLELAKFRLAVDDADLDRSAMLLNVENGTVDLNTGHLRPHDPSDLITQKVNIRFREDAQCPVFESMLHFALSDDEEAVSFLQRAVGYSLTGDTREQVFFFLHGPEATGKSLLLNVLRHLIGEYATHTAFNTFTASQFDNGMQSDLARLANKRLVTASEVNWDKRVDEAKIKAITGGDPITARLLYKNYFQFEPRFKIWLAANDLPRVRATDNAFWRRARVIPFPRTVPKENQDDRLKDKLLAEIEGILAWAVIGAKSWAKSGLGKSKSVEAATTGWKASADHIKRFVTEFVVVDEKCSVTSSELYSAFRAWSVQHGETALPDNQLKRAFEVQGLVSKRMRTGSVWTGIRVRPQ